MVNGIDPANMITENTIALGDPAIGKSTNISRHDVLQALGRSGSSAEDTVPSRADLVASSPALQALLQAAAQSEATDTASPVAAGTPLDAARVAEAVSRSRDATRTDRSSSTFDSRAMANAMNRARQGQSGTRSVNPALAAMTNTATSTNPLAPRQPARAPETVITNVPTLP